MKKKKILHKRMKLLNYLIILILNKPEKLKKVNLSSSSFHSLSDWKGRKGILNNVKC